MTTDDTARDQAWAEYEELSRRFEPDEKIAFITGWNAALRARPEPSQERPSDNLTISTKALLLRAMEHMPERARPEPVGDRVDTQEMPDVASTSVIPDGVLSAADKKVASLISLATPAQPAEDQPGQRFLIDEWLPLKRRIRELERMLRNFVRIADKGLFRDRAELSLAAHPIVDDARALLQGDGK